MALGLCILCQIEHHQKPAIVEWKDDRLCFEHACAEGVPDAVVVAAVEAARQKPAIPDYAVDLEAPAPPPVKHIRPATRAVVASEVVYEPSANAGLRHADDVQVALVNIGYSPRGAQKAAREAAVSNSGFDEIMRGALELLGDRTTKQVPTRTEEATTDTNEGPEETITTSDKEKIMPLKLCKCGCGKPASINRDYAWGHKPKNGAATSAPKVKTEERAPEPRKVEAAKPANGNGHARDEQAAAVATICVSEAHLDRFLTMLPLEDKANLVSEYLSR